jgi:hypothetical protein
MLPVLTPRGAGLSDTRPGYRPVDNRGKYFGLEQALKARGKFQNHSAPGSAGAILAGQWDALAVQIDTYRNLTEAPLIRYTQVMKSISHLCGMILGREQALDGESAAAVRGARAFADFKLAYYNDLKKYGYTDMIGRVKDVVENHFKTLQGKLLVNVADHKHVEYMDPLHRGDRDLPGLWARHVARETRAGRDPYDSIVAFFLKLENRPIVDARAYATDNQRAYYRLLYKSAKEAGGSTRLLCALYHYNMGHRGPRYCHHLDGHNPYTGPFQCRWLYYNSQEYFNAGRSDLHDLVGGDLYVADRDGNFYSFQPSEFHSFLLAGEAVMSAGIMVVKTGKVRAIDNKSGHYQPTWKNLHQAVDELDSNGVFDRDAVVGHVLPGGDAMPDGNVMYYAKDDFLDLGNRHFPFEAAFKVIDRYYRVYKGGLPVPPSQAELIAERDWPRHGNSDRWREYMRAAFPRTVQAILEGVRKLATASSLPSLPDWKKESDAGLFASRDEMTSFIDGALQQYLRTVQQQYERYLPDVAELAAAMRHLEGAVTTWLQHRQDKERSTRRPSVERLRTRLQADKAILDGLRTLPPEAMPLKGMQV